MSRSTTLFGGTGNDNFTVYSNKAELFLFGDEDDDTFTVRAFVKVDPNDPKAPFTNINGGQGADFIAFTVNAPVRIDGGDGFDTLAVIGTEFGDDFVVNDKGVYGAGPVRHLHGAGEDRGRRASRATTASSSRARSESVALEIVGGLGSDTFNVGGSNGQSVTVVSNNLEGHSGLVIQTTTTDDPEYKDMFVQDVSADVRDNDEAGVVVALIGGSLRVFEPGSDPLGLGLAVFQYSIVLTRSPEEAVRVTAAPVPISERERLAGGKSITLNGADAGITLTFDRTNWYIPQTITVAAAADLLAEGTRIVNIQHTFVQGASPDDGGAYDTLIAPGVTVTVVDDESADVLSVSTSPGSNIADDSLLVSEFTDEPNPVVPPPTPADLPATDSYAVVLTHRPNGDVTILVSTDDETDVWNGTAWVSSMTLTFTSVNWFTRQQVLVRATGDNEKEGLHFSRITDTISSDQGLFLGLDTDDIAAGLAAAVEGDLTGRYDASASGSQVTLDGRVGFTAQITGGTIDLTNSIRASTGLLTVTLADGGSGVQAGEKWTLLLNGGSFSYAAAAGDDLEDVADALEAKIDSSSTFRASVSVVAGVVTLTVTPLQGQQYAASFAPGDGLDNDLDGVFDETGESNQTRGSLSAAASTTHWARAIFDITDANGVVAPGETWTIALNANTLARVEFVYVAGRHGESTTPKPVDVKLTDDDQPGVLVLESGGSTGVTEPTRFVVLGDGFVTAWRSATTFEGDFGTAVLKEIEGHNTRENATNLELGKWNANANPDIADLTPGTLGLDPHLTVKGAGNGQSDWFKFTITETMRTLTGGTVTASFDMDRGFQYGDPIVWLSLLKLYNASGDLLAQGRGFSNPDPLGGVGAGGSQTWLDDYLEYSFGAAGDYYLEVGSWLLTSGLPVGVDYELQVSVREHPTAGFVFAPQPVTESEPGNNAATRPAARRRRLLHLLRPGDRQHMGIGRHRSTS